MHNFINYLLQLFQESLIFTVPLLVIGLLILFLVWKRNKSLNKHFSLGKALVLFLLTGWVLVTVYVTVFRASPGGYRVTNFQIFLAWREAWNRFTPQVWLNVLLNIGLFIPLGIMLPIILRCAKSWYGMLTCGFLTSLGIESIQLLLNRGIFDVDDLFTNTLGAMLGWSLTMLLSNVFNRRPGWGRRAVGYLAVPVSFTVAMAVLFGSYAMQPYGNLPDGPVSTVDLSQVSWETVHDPVIAPDHLSVYQVEKRDAEEFAAAFSKLRGITFPDRYEYDNLVIFANHSTGDFLNVYLRDSIWEYSLGDETGVFFETAAKDVTPEALRQELSAWGIAIPENAVVTTEKTSSDAMTVTFTTPRDSGENQMLYGDLSCQLYEQNGRTMLSRVRNNLVHLIQYQEEAVISPQQAFKELQTGHSFYGYVLKSDLERMDINVVKVLSCSLDWKVDTKGFYQPVYRFELGIGAQDHITDFVPALA